ncbi:MAG: hypothetical protein GTO08_03695 [Deltaproteobacteria bacterium]|nr:hypothetical protein [Deltaproteobacteria bacterium]
MAFSATVIRILLASASDVEEERESVHAFINEWNESNTISEKVVLWPVPLSSLAVPETTAASRETITAKLVNDCDILIGLFWTRIDGNTDGKKSRMIEVMEQFIKTGKPSLLYFSTQPVVPDSIDPDQYAQLRGFKEGARKKGGIHQYSSPDELMEMVNKQVLSKIRDIHAKPRAGKPDGDAESATAKSEPKSPAPPPDDTSGKEEKTSKRKDPVEDRQTEDVKHDDASKSEQQRAKVLEMDLPLSDGDVDLDDDVPEIASMAEDAESMLEDAVPDPPPKDKSETKEKKVSRERDPELTKIIKKYLAELSHLEVEWIVERDDEPEDLKAGKSILKNVGNKISDFQNAIQKKVEEVNLDPIKEIIEETKDIQNHRVLADGGKSYDAFWKKGNEIFLKFKDFTGSL